MLQIAFVAIAVAQAAPPATAGNIVAPIVRQMTDKNGVATNYVELVTIDPTPLRLQHSNVLKFARPARFLVILLRSTSPAVEFKLSQEELASQALLAAELAARDDALEKLYRKSDQAEFEKAKLARRGDDEKILKESVGAERAKRLAQLVLHYKGPFRGLQEDPEAAKVVGITKDECFDIYLEIVREHSAPVKPGAEQPKRIHHHLRFVEKLSKTQREKWLKLAGPAPKASKPTDWPSGDL